MTRFPLCSDSAASGLLLSFLFYRFFFTSFLCPLSEPPHTYVHLHSDCRVIGHSRKARGGVSNERDLCVCTGAEYPSLFSSFFPTPLRSPSNPPPSHFHSLCRQSPPPLPWAPRGRRHWPCLWMYEWVGLRAELFHPCISIALSTLGPEIRERPEQYKHAFILRKKLCHAVIKDLFQCFNGFS